MRDSAVRRWRIGKCGGDKRRTLTTTARTDGYDWTYCLENHLQQELV